MERCTASQAEVEDKEYKIQIVYDRENSVMFLLLKLKL